MNETDSLAAVAICSHLRVIYLTFCVQRLWQYTMVRLVYNLLGWIGGSIEMESTNSTVGCPLDPNLPQKELTTSKKYQQEFIPAMQVQLIGRKDVN